MTPPCSVIIPWANRKELAVTMRENRALYSTHGIETIVMNVGGDVNRLLDMLVDADVPNVTVIDLPGATFSRALGLNIGAQASAGEMLFFMDADIILRSDIFADALGVLRSRDCFVAVQDIYETPPPELSGPDRPTKAIDWGFLSEWTTMTEMVTRDGRRAVHRRRIFPGRTRAGDGLVLLRKEHFYAVNGLNAGLVGWGYEDCDFQNRVQWLLGLERVEAGEVEHLPHGRESLDSQAHSSRLNMRACIDNYYREHYLGTLDADCERWRDVLVTIPVTSIQVAATVRA
jgi:hypothetical protein